MNVSILKNLLTSDNTKIGVGVVAGVKILKSSKTFNNIWDITIGNRLEAWNQKSIFKNQQDVEKFKNDCLEKISKIPENKIQDPKLSIIGPALEASKFYIEEEEIRNMFSNLVAASMNSEHDDKIHHSFIEIIKQLSPYDAILFNSLKPSNPFLEISFKVLDDDSHGEIPFIPIFFTNKLCGDYRKNPISLTNLEKQGLIKFPHNCHLLTQGIYNDLYNHPEYLKLKHTKLAPIELQNDHHSIEIKDTKKLFELTPLGNAFKKICCTNP